MIKKIGNGQTRFRIAFQVLSFAALVVTLSACGGGSGGGGGGGGGPSPDTTPPSAITDLSKVAGTRGTLTWTAPGNDGSVGSASSYDIRISTAPITEANFASATRVTNAPTPKQAGSKEQLTLPGLSINQTYYLAIKTTDAAGNQSPLSSPFSFTPVLEEVSLSGLNSGDIFGQVVAKAGDINGDGIPDILVGAPFYKFKRGAVYIFYGGPTIGATPNVTLEGLQVGEQFGYSVAGAGDVNGDGCTDIIVGAYQHSSSTSLTNNGAVYIYYGSGGTPCPSVINTSPNVTLEGIGSNDGLGYSVTGTGDINKDGFSDFLIGAPFRNSDRGEAYLFLGAKSIAAANITLTGDAPGDRFGFSVSGGRDISGDGVPDIAVGGYEPTGSLRLGAAYVFYGATLSDRPASGAEVIFTGALVDDQLGWSVAITGDMNGDGRADLAVGTPFPDGDKGMVYLFYSGAGFKDKNASAADVILTGISSGDQFGWAVADAGDVNVDGFHDLIVGAPSSTPQSGKAFIFYGGPGLRSNITASSANVSLSGRASGDTFGYSVAGIGDTNGDGYDEIAVGARLNDNNGFLDNGAVYIKR